MEHSHYPNGPFLCGVSIFDMLCFLSQNRYEVCFLLAVFLFVLRRTVLTPLLLHRIAFEHQTYDMYSFTTVVPVSTTRIFRGLPLLSTNWFLRYVLLAPPPRLVST